MKITPRKYQADAMQSIVEYWAAGGGNPVVDLPTGTGKSVVIAMLCDWARSVGARVLIIAHVKELLAQNFEELRAMSPELSAGVYSAGLKARDTRQPIIFAGIQSVYEKAELFGARQIVIVDEAHLVPHSELGMYHRFFADVMRIEPHMRVAGLTATPYRMSSGLITEDWKDQAALFDAIVYQQPITFFMENGFLAPLVTKGTETKLDASGVPMRGGEFAAGKLGAACNKDNITEAAIGEVYQWGDGRRGWLFFGAGSDHAKRIAEICTAHGVECGVVTDKTPAGERDELVAGFKLGQLRALANNRVLTTGFNAPHVDLIADLQPTGSPGLHVQKYGRGTRRAEGKSNCLILDFAGNSFRHGPLDTINGRKKPGEGTAPQKQCPDCAEIVPAGLRVCACGYEWPEAELRISANAASAALLSTHAEPTWLYVTKARTAAHPAKSGFTSMRVSYQCGLLEQVNEFICFEHPASSPALGMAHRWWRRHGGRDPVPARVDEALARQGELRFAGRLLVARTGKYWSIIERDLATAIA